MNIRLLARRSSLLLVIALLSIALAARAALADQPATEGGPALVAPAATAVTPPAAPPDGAPPAAPAKDTGPAATDTGEIALRADDAAPVYGGRAPDENLPPGSSVSGAAPRATFSYYMASGATLRGRNSSTGYAYAGNGCAYVTSGTTTGRILNTELYIPDGSIIKYLRVYFNDTNASGSVAGFITRYQPGVAVSDLVSASSTAAYAGGYSFVVSSEITETVNNTSYAYTLIGWPSDSVSSLQICGLRVAYYAPISVASFMPIITKDLAP